MKILMTWTEYIPCASSSKGGNFALGYYSISINRYTLDNFTITKKQTSPFHDLPMMMATRKGHALVILIIDCDTK